MANSGPNTNGSQFYVSYSRQPSLDNVYSVIGRLIGDASFATLDAMEAAPVGAKYRPVPGKEVKVTHVTIHANPFAEV